MAYRARSTIETPELVRFKEIGWDVTETGCWEWRGVRNKISGRSLDYGRFRLSGGRKSSRLVLAHRFAYETFCAPIEKDAVIGHTCDNPPCVNPDHLRAISQKTNIEESFIRGRRKRLGDDIIAHIRQLYADGEFTQRGLSEEFGISRSYISQIVNNLRRV